MTSVLTIVAHRGGSALAPENSMAAFAQALDLGIDVIEVDIRVSRDGHFVLFHDDNLLRLADRPDRVEEMDLFDLQNIVIGEDSTFGDQGVAKLEDLFQLIKQSKKSTRVLLDIKLPGGYETAIVETIQESGLDQDVVLGVRTIESLKVFKRISPHILTLSFGYPEEVVWRMAEQDVDIIRLWSMWVNYDTITQAKELGKAIWVMCGNPNEKEGGETTLQMLLNYRKMDVEGVILNNPILALQANTIEIT